MRMSCFEYEYINPKNGGIEEVLHNVFEKPSGRKFIRVGKEKVLLTERYLTFAQDIENMEIYEDDIWVISHPKTGTTWTQEMVWCIANDVDLETAKRIPLFERFPFIEGSSLASPKEIEADEVENSSPGPLLNTVSRAINQPSPRFIKTHLQWSVLPKQIRLGEKKPKIVYVARNAKDTCVSYFHHSLVISGYQGDMDDFCKLFIGNMLNFQPFWSHVLEFWKRHEDENILFLKYEDMKKDLPSVIKNVAAFLKKDLTEDQVVSLTNHLSFESMKNNPAVNNEKHMEKMKRLKDIKHPVHFIRSGQVGGWKQEMSKEMAEKFDEWSKENLKNTGLVLEESKNVSEK